MGRAKVYICEPCVQQFTGRKAYDYHMRAHRRLLTTAEKGVARHAAESVLPLGNRPTEAATEGDTLWKSS